jgi:hypothetical protein
MSVVAALAVAGSLPTTWLLPHYLAAAVPLLLLLVVEGIRRLRCWTWKGRPCGRTAVWDWECLPPRASVRDYAGRAMDRPLPSTAAGPVERASGGIVR